MLPLLIAAGVVLVLDQLSKSLVRRLPTEGKTFSLDAFVQIRCLRNAPGSLRSRFNIATLLLLWGCAVLSIIALVQYGWLFQSVAAQVGLGVALGGASGNLIDLLWRGAVVDFIDFSFWPVFNIADVAIVLGLVVAFWFR
jgi:signal peptidase II